VCYAADARDSNLSRAPGYLSYASNAVSPIACETQAPAVQNSVARRASSRSCEEQSFDSLPFGVTTQVEQSGRWVSRSLTTLRTPGSPGPEDLFRWSCICRECASDVIERKCIGSWLSDLQSRSPAYLCLLLPQQFSYCEAFGVVLTKMHPRGVSDLDNNLPLFDVRTQTERIERFGSQRTAAGRRLATLFGLLALVLACIGCTDCWPYEVARRTREIGSPALGAHHRDVLPDEDKD